MDATGRLPVRELLWALAQEEGWGYVRRSHLEEVVNVTSPGAFELDQTHIRALQPGPANLRSQDAAWPPPTLLYRAITAKSHGVVAERGLQAPTGGELVLAADPEMARRLGRRRDPQAVLVVIQAQSAAKKGVEFFPYGEGLYLSGPIGPEYLQLPAAPKKPEAKPATLGEVGPGAAHPGVGVAGHHGPTHQTLERERPEKRPGLEGRGQRAAAAEEGLNEKRGK